jgi:hypothetical protein
MTTFCPHCDNELGGHLVLTADGHSFRSYWRREHGDVVPRDDEDEERVQGDLPNVQDSIPIAATMVERGCEGVMPEQGMPGEA